MHLYFPRRVLLAVLVSLMAVVGSFVIAPSAAAAQQQDANLYAFWSYSPTSSLTNSDQQVRFTQKARYTYLAQSWTWTTSPDGGYIGLQTDGSRFNGTTGDMAIYSVWNAGAAKAASGATCGQFDGEGAGWSCRRALAISTTHFYQLHVARGTLDSVGQWWSASIQDTSTTTTYGLGSIRVARTDRYMNAPMNFSEYFGPAVPTCSNVPVSIADWTRPAGNKTSTGYGTVGSFSKGDRGACTGGSVTARTNNSLPGARIVMGGVVT